MAVTRQSSRAKAALRMRTTRLGQTDYRWMPALLGDGADKSIASLSHAPPLDRSASTRVWPISSTEESAYGLESCFQNHASSRADARAKRSWRTNILSVVRTTDASAASWPLHTDVA